MSEEPKPVTRRAFVPKQYARMLTVMNEQNRKPKKPDPGKPPRKEEEA